MTEQEIYMGALSKEPKFQTLLYTTYYKKLLMISKKYTKNEQDAEDCVQDAFARIFQKLDTFKNEGSFEGWMIKVAKNIALKKYVGLKYQNEITNDSTAYSHNPSFSPSPESILEHKKILSLLEKVPEKMRKVFRLYEIEGYDHDEISKMMKIKAGTSRSQLMKAKTKMKELIY